MARDCATEPSDELPRDEREDRFLEQSPFLRGVS